MRTQIPILNPRPPEPEDREPEVPGPYQVAAVVVSPEPGDDLRTYAVKVGKASRALQNQMNQAFRAGFQFLTHVPVECGALFVYVPRPPEHQENGVKQNEQ